MACTTTTTAASAVPAFLTKLWTLVEDEHTSHLVCWSQEGNSFLVLDEQRFSKEILPKFFKHNNMASFVRQLNMYGFRKVIHMDSGIVKQERDGPIEFQHSYFRHGRDDLLENIKRKVSNTRPEDNRLRQDDLSRILSSVQTVHDKQETMDVRLATLKRENEDLWSEMSDLRQKHTQQQKAIKKLVRFILTLAQNNHLLNLKRKRPLLLNSNGKKSKFISQGFDDPVEQSNSAVSGFSTLRNSDITDDAILFAATDEEAEVTVDAPRTEDDGDGEMIQVNHESTEVAEMAGANATEPTDSVLDEDDSSIHSSIISLQLSPASSLLIQEDPVKMMDAILRESGTISQNINLLGKVELMDYLDSIDCSLEDFQAFLYGKQFSGDALQGAELNTKDQGVPNQTVCDHAASDKNLIQYTSCPLLNFLDDCDSQPKEVSQKPGDEDTMDLLDSPLVTPKAPRSRSSLEPLTEAEVRETTLFYLCELDLELQSEPQLEF